MALKKRNNICNSHQNLLCYSWRKLGNFSSIQQKFNISLAQFMMNGYSKVSTLLKEIIKFTWLNKELKKNYFGHFWLCILFLASFTFPIERINQLNKLYFLVFLARKWFKATKASKVSSEIAIKTDCLLSNWLYLLFIFHHLKSKFQTKFYFLFFNNFRNTCLIYFIFIK